MKKKLIISLILCTVAAFLIIILLFLFYEIKYPLKFENEINIYSKKYQLESSFVAAIINTESSFKPDAKSKSGAEGLMQLMPSTAQFVAQKYRIPFDDKNLFDVHKNIEIGCCYLRYLFDKFDDKRTVLFAYNSGEGNVVSWLEMSEFSSDKKKLNSCPFAQSNAYVKNVLSAQKYYNKKMPT